MADNLAEKGGVSKNTGFYKSEGEEMPSAGAITKTIRLSPTDREMVEGLMNSEGLTWSGAIHKLITEGGTPKSGYQKTRENKKPGKGTPYGKDSTSVMAENQGKIYHQDLMDRAVERDIGEMCKLSGISTHDFYRGICELFTDGQIGIDAGRVRSFGEYDLRDFESVCYRLHQRPKEMLEKLTRSLERSV